MARRIFWCPQGRKGPLWRAHCGLGLQRDILLVTQRCSREQLPVCCSWWGLNFIGRQFFPQRKEKTIAFLHLSKRCIYFCLPYWRSSVCSWQSLSHHIDWACRGPLWWDRAGDNGASCPHSPWVPRLPRAQQCQSFLTSRRSLLYITEKTWQYLLSSLIANKFQN